MRLILFSCLLFLLPPALSAQKKNEKISILKVYGTCSQCKHRIESALDRMHVYKANWEIDSRLLTVSYDSTRLTLPAMAKRLAAAGHDTELYQATDAAYQSLPKCCYYERYLPGAIPAGLPDSLRSILPDPSTHTLTGVILEEDRKGKLSPLTRATVRCLSTGLTRSTDSAGVFQLPCAVPVRLAISYVSYKTDTVSITSASDIKIILKNASVSSLHEVVITSRNPSTYISSLSTFNTLHMGSVELTKAACCNLSESFETSPSVDVNYADAVTGIKQIQLLGLAGNYTQITTENIPEIRGLAGIYGLGYVPGPWIEGIQVTRGTGSVANGYESIAGQINVEEIKPDKANKVFINSYVNEMGRLETTVNLARKINDRWSTALLTHANGVVAKSDRNHDGFLDIPTGRQFNVINRWRYAGTNGLFAQFAIKALDDRRQAGQLSFNPSMDKFTTRAYGVGIQATQYAYSGKLGYVFPQQKYKSIGLIFSGNMYNNDSYYGLTAYNGQQRTVYANLIYQSIIGNTNHKYRAGLSFINDNYNEYLGNRNFSRRETVPGVFGEYTFTDGEKFTAVAGLRLDYHNQYGWIVTPRLNLKYNFTPQTSLRLSGGSGFRTANIFAENIGLFASARKYAILNPSTNYGYGLNPEKAWNYGINLVHNFKINTHSGSVSLDAYRTSFLNQVVVDVDASPQRILFYNLNGKSYSNSLQAELNYSPMDRLDIRLAYRWLDVKTEYAQGLLQKPLTAKSRGFINLAYATANHWKFDLTVQRFSRKRLPFTGSNPVGKQLPDFSPAFAQASAQVTKQFGSHWEVYLGAENLTNYTQEQVILSADQPFGPYFDASMVWGPVNGRMYYAGMRYKLP